jgi:hypothetical protein
MQTSVSQDMGAGFSRCAGMGPAMSNKRKWGTAVIILILLGVLGYWTYEKSRQVRVLERCNKVGGVYVESRTGPICINPGALLNF